LWGKDFTVKLLQVSTDFSRAAPAGSKFTTLPSGNKQLEYLQRCYGRFATEKFGLNVHQKIIDIFKALNKPCRHLS